MLKNAETNEMEGKIVVKTWSLLGKCLRKRCTDESVGAHWRETGPASHT